MRLSGWKRSGLPTCKPNAGVRNHVRSREDQDPWRACSIFFQHSVVLVVANPSGCAPAPHNYRPPSADCLEAARALLVPSHRALADPSFAGNSLNMPERATPPPAPAPMGPKPGGDGDGPKAPNVDRPDTKDLLKRMKRVDPDQSRRYRQRTGE